MDAPRYSTGEPIAVGDQIKLAGRRGVVVFVLETASFLPGYDPNDWLFLGKGFMMEVDGYGLVHHESADEDLVLVARQGVAPPE
jgi:hypothetical protein